MAESETPSHALLRALRDYGAAAREASLPGLVALKIREIDLKGVRFVLENPGSRAGELSRHLGITSAATTALIDRLVLKGLLRRDTSASDRRTRIVYATVDRHTEPWSSFDAFDRAAGDVATRWPPATVAAAAELIDEMARSTAVDVET